MKKLKEMNKNQKNLLLILLVIIIVIVVISIVMVTNNNSSSGDNPNNNPTNLPGNQTGPVTEISTFDISKFQVKKDTKNEVSMLFKITNKGNKDIVGKSLDINMYDGSKLLYTYGYVIEDLKVSEYIYVQANANFTYDKITKFEFVIDDEKVIVEPTYVD